MVNHRVLREIQSLNSGTELLGNLVILKESSLLAKLLERKTVTKPAYYFESSNQKR